MAHSKPLMLLKLLEMNIEIQKAKLDKTIMKTFDVTFSFISGLYICLGVKFFIWCIVTK